MAKYRILLIFSAVLLVSCNGGNIKHQARSLEQAITEYNTGLRWGMFNNIDAYSRSPDGEHIPVDREAMKNIRITGYDVTEKILNEDATEAVVKGEINYYSNEYGTLKKIPFEQKWWYDTSTKHWFVESGLPEFN